MTNKEDVAVGIGGANGGTVLGPLGVENRTVALGVTLLLDHVPVLEEHSPGFQVPNNDVTIMGSR